MELSLDCPSSTSDTGAYRIAWSDAGGDAVRIEENGAVLYEGGHDATTVSGRSSGEYVYRIGVLDSDNVHWTDSCTVSVEPPSLALAFVLFGVGITVFTSLVAVVIRGHHAHGRGELRD